MTESEQDAYHAKAAEEQAMRVEAAQCPFPSRFSKANGLPPAETLAQEAAANLSANALKKISRQRLMTTYTEFRQSPAWNELEAGLHTPDGCMDLDCIDVETPLTSIQETWDNFVRGDVGDVLSVSEDFASTVHHTVCHMEYGACKTLPGNSLAAKFVHSMASLIAEGGLALSVLG